MPSYVTKTVRRHRWLFLGAACLGGVLAGVVWTWGAATGPADPFARDYTEAELAKHIARGHAVFVEQNCVECHALPASGGVDDAGDPGAAGVGLKGPSLVGIVDRTVTLDSGRIVLRDHRYLRRAIRDARADIVKGYTFQVMPDYSHLSEADTSAVMLMIRSLGEGADLTED